MIGLPRERGGGERFWIERADKESRRKGAGEGMAGRATRDQPSSRFICPRAYTRRRSLCTRARVCSARACRDYGCSGARAHTRVS